VLVPEPTGARTHASVRVRAGGSAVNAALAAARIGARAAVVGRVGDDAVGRLVAEELRAAGVDPVLAVDAERPTGSVAVVGSAFVADRGANAGFVADDLPARLDARVVLVSGYLLFHEDSGPGAAEALDRATGLTAVDLASTELARDVGADVLIGPAAAVEGLPRDRRVVCATLGADGAIAFRDDEVVRAAPPHRLDDEPVGAGDAFAAVFVLALADGLPLQEALARGCAAGAAV
jgi:ribokinase